MFLTYNAKNPKKNNHMGQISLKKNLSPKNVHATNLYKK